MVHDATATYAGVIPVPPGTTLVVGLGLSGRAICRHLARDGVPFMVADTRQAPPGLDDFRTAHPGVAVHLGPLDALDLEAVGGGGAELPASIRAQRGSRRWPAGAIPPPASRD